VKQIGALAVPAQYRVLEQNSSNPVFIPESQPLFIQFCRFSNPVSETKYLV